MGEVHLGRSADFKVDWKVRAPAAVPDHRCRLSDALDLYGNNGDQSRLAPSRQQIYSTAMSIEALKSELQALSDEERRKLMAFMVVLEDQAQAAYASKLAERIDNRSPERWLTPEQCERELGLDDGRDNRK